MNAWINTGTFAFHSGSVVPCPQPGIVMNSQLFPESIWLRTLGAVCVSLGY